MKIVLIGKYNNTELLNGPEKVAKRLFENLSKTESGVTFIDYFFKNTGKSSLALRLFGYQESGNNGNIIRMGILRLFLFLVKNQPDVIHLVTEERYQLSIFLYRFLLTGKMYVTFHGLLKYESEHLAVKYKAYSRLKDRILEYLLLTISDKLIFVSRKLLDLTAQHYKFDRGKAVIIPNGVDLEFYSKKIFDFTHSVKIVLYSGEIRNNAAIEHLKESLKAFTNKKIEVFILDNSINAKEEHGSFIINYCKLLPKEELVKFLEDKHLYININGYESFSIFALECMASGLIPIVSNDVGMSEYIENGVNGFSIQAAGPGELSTVLKNIAEGSYDLASISRNAASIKEILNWPQVTEKYYDLYKLDS